MALGSVDTDGSLLCVHFTFLIATGGRNSAFITAAGAGDSRMCNGKCVMK